MGSVRVDELTGCTVVIAENRVPGPPAFQRGTLPQVASCPFCPGREGETGHTIAERTDATGWVVRAFPNRRPGLRPEEPHHRIGHPGLFGWTSVGAHEVIAEGRAHDVTALPLEVATESLWLVADRTEDLRRDTRNAVVGWFRNRGLQAGSSQPHPHSQVVAMPVVPGQLARMMHSAASDEHIFERSIELARRDRRVIVEEEGVVAFAPWAPRSSFEVWFVPTGRASFLWADRGRIPGLAMAMHKVETALHGAFGFAAHNAMLFDAPCQEPSPGLRWHIRLHPRLIPTGGFELWSDGAMHPIPPQQSAAVLRGFVP